MGGQPWPAEVHSPGTEEPRGVGRGKAGSALYEADGQAEAGFV